MDARKYKLRFTFIDVFIFISLTVGLLFLYAKPSPKTEDVVYTLLVVTDAAYADCFYVGARLLDGVGKAYCGTLTFVKREPYFKESSRGKTEDESKARLILTVSGKGVCKNGILTVGSLTLIPGKAVYLHTPCVCEGLCLGEGEVIPL